MVHVSCRHQGSGKMKIIRAFVCCAVVIIACGGRTSAQTFGASDAVENTASGSINWTLGEVYATGIGAPPPNPANAAQARAMAERAAFVVAIRNLLETVKGVRVDSETVVENFMTKSDIIRTSVTGLVRGAQIVKKQYLSDGSVEVLVGMPMRGDFMNAIVPETFGRTSTTPAPRITSPTPQKPPEVKPAPSVPEPAKPAPPAAKVPETKPEPIKPALSQPEKKAEPIKPVPSQPAPGNQSESTVAFKGGVATGLVIDARGLGLKPALLPKIVDQQGRELYVGQVVPRTNAVEQGVAGYAKDVNAASNNFRVTDNPAVLKGLGASGSARTDVVIGQADAQALRQLGSKGDFLQYCRVIIVY
jgi:hypothetical protein